MKDGKHEGRKREARREIRTNLIQFQRVKFGPGCGEEFLGGFAIGTVGFAEDRCGGGLFVSMVWERRGG